MQAPMQYRRQFENTVVFFFCLWINAEVDVSIVLSHTLIHTEQTPRHTAEDSENRLSLENDMKQDFF